MTPKEEIQSILKQYNLDNIECHNCNYTINLADLYGKKPYHIIQYCRCRLIGISYNPYIITINKSVELNDVDYKITIEIVLQSDKSIACTTYATGKGLTFKSNNIAFSDLQNNEAILYEIETMITFT